MTGQYELVVLYHPDLEIDLAKAEAKVTKIVTGNGGSVTKQDVWGKRKMAYKINNQEHAVYVVYELDLPAESVSKINNTLNITDEVIRFLLIKPDVKRINRSEIAKAQAKARRERLGENGKSAPSEKEESTEEEE